MPSSLSAIFSMAYNEKVQCPASQDQLAIKSRFVAKRHLSTTFPLNHPLNTFVIKYPQSLCQSDKADEEKLVNTARRPLNSEKAGDVSTHSPFALAGPPPNPISCGLCTKFRGFLYISAIGDAIKSLTPHCRAHSVSARWLILFNQLSLFLVLSASPVVWPSAVLAAGDAGPITPHWNVLNWLAHRHHI